MNHFKRVRYSIFRDIEKAAARRNVNRLRYYERRWIAGELDNQIGSMAVGYLTMIEDKKDNIRRVKPWK